MLKELLIQTKAITNAVKISSKAEHLVNNKYFVKNCQVSRLKILNHCNNVFALVKLKATLIS